MKKQDQIAFYKRQKDSAGTLKEVSMQNYQIATQLESEADRALERLGNSPRLARKGKEVLSESVKLKLVSGLTPNTGVQK